MAKSNITPQVKTLVVSPMPPESTGIAEFSAIVFADESKYTLLSTEERDISRFYKLASLPEHRVLLFVLGNSDHNLPVLRLLRSLAGFPARIKKIFVQVHDPVISNISYKFCQQTNIDYFKTYANARKERMEIDTGNPADMPSCIYRAWDEKGVTGWLPIIRDVNVHTFITHSAAASRILENDFYRSNLELPKILKLFHPTFTPVREGQHLREERQYDVGIFGILDSGGKCSDIALNAILTAHSRGVIESCVLAGYNAKRYLSEKKYAPPPWMKVLENPSTNELLSAMNNTRVAVQLRRSNTGESSGVIPQLLACGVIPIVSNVGAFTELPDEIVLKSENSIEHLQVKIEMAIRLWKAVGDIKSRNMLINRFVATTKVSRFNEALQFHIKDSMGFTFIRRI